MLPSVRPPELRLQTRQWWPTGRLSGPCQCRQKSISQFDTSSSALPSRQRSAAGAGWWLTLSRRRSASALWRWLRALMTKRASRGGSTCPWPDAQHHRSTRCTTGNAPGLRGRRGPVRHGSLIRGPCGTQNRGDNPIRTASSEFWKHAPKPLRQHIAPSPCRRAACADCARTPGPRRFQHRTCAKKKGGRGMEWKGREEKQKKTGKRGKKKKKKERKRQSVPLFCLDIKCQR